MKKEMVEDMSLEDRLIVLKRLSGLQSASFTVLVDEENELYIIGMEAHKDERTSFEDPDEEEPSTNLLKVGDRVFRLPEPSLKGGGRQVYFG